MPASPRDEGGLAGDGEQVGHGRVRLSEGEAPTLSCERRLGSAPDPCQAGRGPDGQAQQGTWARAARRRLQPIRARGRSLEHRVSPPAWSGWASSPRPDRTHGACSRAPGAGLASLRPPVVVWSSGWWLASPDTLISLSHPWPRSAGSRGSPSSARPTASPPRRRPPRAAPPGTAMPGRTSAAVEVRGPGGRLHLAAFEVRVLDRVHVDRLAVGVHRPRRGPGRHRVPAVEARRVVVGHRDAGPGRRRRPRAASGGWGSARRRAWPKTLSTAAVTALFTTMVPVCGWPSKPQ